MEPLAIILKCNVKSEKSIIMLAFNKLAISDPRFEMDNIRYLTVKSSNLKGRGDLSVFVPPGSDYQHLPIVLLLHGVYGSHWAWTHLAGVHRQMLNGIESGLIKPMVLVMPSDGLWGDGSGYIPHKQQNFEKWIVEDVLDAVTYSIKETSKTSPIFIAGLSMGGYGALRLGAKYGTKFKAVSALSSLTDAKQMQALLEEDITGLLEINADEQSVLDVILRNRNILPDIRFDCGAEDPLITENRKLAGELLKNDIPHVYEEFDGVHDWDYWTENIFRTLLFFSNRV